MVRDRSEQVNRARPRLPPLVTAGVRSSRLFDLREGIFLQDHGFAHARDPSMRLEEGPYIGRQHQLRAGEFLFPAMRAARLEDAGKADRPFGGSSPVATSTGGSPT
jgi:hypothetical protein